MANQDDTKQDERDDLIAGVVGPVVPQRMTTVTSVRLDPGVAAELRDLANARGVTLSQLLREGALKVANEPNMMTIEWITPPTVVTDYGRSATFTAPEPDPRTLAAKLDALTVASQDLTAQLVRVKAEVLRLYDEADIEARVDDVPSSQRFPTADELRPYVGQCVAIKDGAVVRWGVSYRALVAGMREEGLTADSVFRVPSRPDEVA